MATKKQNLKAVSQSLDYDRLNKARSHAKDAGNFDLAKVYIWGLLLSAMLSLFTCSYVLIKPPPASKPIRIVTTHANVVTMPASVISLHASLQDYEKIKLEAQQSRLQKAKICLPLALLALLASFAMLKTFTPARAPAYTIACMILVLTSLNFLSIAIMAIFLIPALRSSLRHKKFLESKDSPALTLPS